MSFNIFSEVDFIKETDIITFLSKSNYDNKYVITRKNKKYLLSIFKNSYFYDNIQKKIFLDYLNNVGIESHRIINLGFCESGIYSYSIYNWIDGEVLESRLKAGNDLFCYEIGKQCGKLLKSIHNISFDIQNSNEINDLASKYLSQKEKYLKYENEFRFISVFLNYLENYKEYKFKVSSNSILHGDFHVNNLIYRSGKIYIIDWIYGEKGDCCKDFVRNIVNAYVSPIYARGQIDGYFNGNPCDEFWEKLLVFTILHQLELIDMIGRFNFITNDFINTQHNNVIYQYNNLKSNIPLYYKEG